MLSTARPRPSTIDVRRADDDRRRWNRAVERSPQATVLHRFEALDVMAEFSGTTATPLLGYESGELAGLFPVFDLSKGPATAVFSPPPHLWVQKLGPAFPRADGLDRHEAERRRHRFVDGVFEWLRVHRTPWYVRVLTNRGLHDPRPFAWNGCDVTPEYTYVVDLRVGADELLERFSGDARRNIRNGDREDYDIGPGDGDDVVWVMEQVIERYDEQDEPFPVPPEFPLALYDRVPDGAIRPYVFRLDGDVIGGIITYDDGETVGRWYGGVTPDADLDVPVNDLLDWHVMRDAVDRGRSFYDLVGAGDPRLNRYKAKFSPQLDTFYRAEGASVPVRLLLGAYRSIRDRGSG